MTIQVTVFNDNASEDVSLTRCGSLLKTVSTVLSGEEGFTQTSDILLPMTSYGSGNKQSALKPITLVQVNILLVFD